MSTDDPRGGPRMPLREVPDDLSLSLSEDMLAAEYVLGTLDPAEREDAKTRITSDFSFAALVKNWERRLGELHALTGDAEPSGSVWDAIKAKLPIAAPSAGMHLPAVEEPQQPQVETGNVVDLTGRLTRWRNVSLFMGSLAATLLAFVVTSVVAPGSLPGRLRPKFETTGPTAASDAASSSRLVAVLQREATAPAFIITVDVANRTLTMRRVGAPREPGKSYELWLISNKFPAPRSLGLAGGGDFTQSNELAAYDPATIEDATFAVSLEPEGGSPTGAPSNVMFLGKPVESTPPRVARPAAR
jgi:anti-sigma-K factor RskA